MSLCLFPLSQVAFLPITASMIIAQLAIQTKTIVENGIGMGSTIAIVCSWQRNRSICWAILAAFLSWLYVIYFAVTRTPDEEK